MKIFAASAFLLCLPLFAPDCAAASIKKHEALLRSSLPCCGSYSQIQYQAIPSADEVFAIDKSSPVFDFETGRSYFAAFELGSDSPREFSLKSYFTGLFIGPYFEPRVLILDEHHAVLESYRLRTRFVEANMFSDGRSHMLGSFEVGDSARYLIIHTEPLNNPNRLINTRPHETGYMSGGSFVGISSGSKKIKVTPSPVGKLKLEVPE